MNLTRSGALVATAEPDPITLGAIEPFDLAWSGESTFVPWAPPDLPTDFSLGVIVGSSGSGKSTLLRSLGGPTPSPAWNDGALAAHFGSSADAIARLTAVGLGSVPLWTRPRSALSNGEGFRADLARQLEDGARIDEFSSVVDRHVAQAASVGFSRYIRRNGLKDVVVATCHRDVLPWLNPDWYIDTDSGLLVTDTREYVQPVPLVVEVRRARRDAWSVFEPHHYLSGNLHPFARCYIASWEDQLVGFAASIPFPHGHIKGAWRESRTVILPEFQGLGLGVGLSDSVAALHRADGLRYYSRTQHPRMGAHRQARPDLWKPTSTNLKRAKPSRSNVPDDEREAGFRTGSAMSANHRYDYNRVAFSHEYIGPASDVIDPIALASRQRREGKAYNYGKYTPKPKHE